MKDKPIRCLRIRDIYGTFKKFKKESDFWKTKVTPGGLAERFGFKSVRAAWKANPTYNSLMNKLDKF